MKETFYNVLRFLWTVTLLMVMFFSWIFITWAYQSCGQEWLYAYEKELGGGRGELSVNVFVLLPTILLSISLVVLSTASWWDKWK